MEQENIEERKLRKSLRSINEQNKLILYKLKRASKHYHGKFREHIFIALTSALGLVIGLSWKDFINKIVDTSISSQK